MKEQMLLPKRKLSHAKEERHDEHEFSTRHVAQPSSPALRHFDEAVFLPMPGDTEDKEGRKSCMMSLHVMFCLLPLLFTRSFLFSVPVLSLVLYVLWK